MMLASAPSTIRQKLLQHQDTNREELLSSDHPSPTSERAPLIASPSGFEHHVLVSLSYFRSCLIHYDVTRCYTDPAASLLLILLCSLCSVTLFPSLCSFALSCLHCSVSTCCANVAQSTLTLHLHNVSLFHLMIVSNVLSSHRSSSAHFTVLDVFDDACDK